MKSAFVRVLSLATILGAPAMGSYASLALADDASRISTLESTVQQLRIRIDEQSRRIERLEAELDGRKGVPSIKPPASRREEHAPQAATGKQPWHAPEAWARVMKGMTRAQVTEILGSPTAVESLDTFTTLFYRAGSLNGLVNFREDRVVAINRPAFEG
jgi:hypothetical protein